MGNVDSAPAQGPPHSHHHPGSVANGNGHLQSSVYPAGQSFHQVVDTRGAPVGSDYVEIVSALESITKEDMERRFLEIVVSRCKFYPRPPRGIKYV